METDCDPGVVFDTLLAQGFSKLFLLFVTFDIMLGGSLHVSLCRFFLFILITEIFSNRLSAATVNRSNFSSSVANNDA